MKMVMLSPQYLVSSRNILDLHQYTRPGMGSKTRWPVSRSFVLGRWDMISFEFEILVQPITVLKYDRFRA